MKLINGQRSTRNDRHYDEYATANGEGSFIGQDYRNRQIGKEIKWDCGTNIKRMIYYLGRGSLRGLKLKYDSARIAARLIVHLGAVRICRCRNMRFSLFPPLGTLCSGADECSWSKTSIFCKQSNRIYVM